MLDTFAVIFCNATEDAYQVRKLIIFTIEICSGH